MKISRRFTKPGQDVFEAVKWEKRTSRISNPDGSVVFEMNDAEVPAGWSQLATDIMVSKYFRKAGVPQRDENGHELRDAAGKVVTGPEKSARQVIHRLAGCWRWWGETHGYFDSAEDAQAFYDEIAHMMLHQMCAPNSPQWFNTGLNFAYGITGPAQGHFFCDPKTGELRKSADAYSHPQPHACQPYNAPVSTPQGRIAIGKIVKENLVGLEVYDGRTDRGGVTRVVAVKANGRKQVMRVILEGGTTVEATGDHLVYVKTSSGLSGRWVRVDALERGMKLVKVCRPRPAADDRPGRRRQERASSAPAAAVPKHLLQDEAVAALKQKEATTTVNVLELSVLRVVAIGAHEVFDIQTESGQYLSNDVIVHNCFIQSVQDDLVNEGGIMDLWTREARLFKYGSGCTSGDSRVYVEGEGFIQIRDLFGRFRDEGRAVREFDGKGRYIDVSDLGLQTLSVDPETGVYGLDRIDWVWQYDVAAEDKLTVRFDTGAKAVVSAWHPFLVWDGRVVVERRADQLRRGDVVLGPNETAVASLPVKETEVVYDTAHYNSSESHRVRIDADLAWLCGYFMGDGSLCAHRSRTTNKYGTTYQYDGLRLRFHDETVEVLQRVQAVVERVFGERAVVQEDGRGSKGRNLTYKGRRVTGFFAALFDAGPKAKTLRMPQFVWEAGPDLVAAFVAGLIDSDGWVADGRAMYATASDAFADELATLASVYGLGGGVLRDRSVAKVTVLARRVGPERRSALAAHVTHPGRKARLLDYAPSAHERKFCMPLADELKADLFGDGHAPADWLRLPVGPDGETLHLGRLQYEGVVNPLKLEKGLALLGRNDLLAERLARIARSASFVTGVEPCSDNPDFYDLTVARHSNYLAGEHGLVAIHNTGTNFSRVRGENEPLSGGGKSSGLMSFLKIGDRAAGAIKSGGTTRRAAKMVCLDLDHPDVETFINWKVREELKVAAMVEGLKVLPKEQQETAKRLGLKLDYDFNGEAYYTVSGQNSNNSVRIPNAFFHALEEDGDWHLTYRSTGKVSRTIKARDLWDQIAYAAWRCADPGVQYDGTINQWHTCPTSGRINASNPCVTGDTRVLTPGGIWRRIDQMIHLPTRVVTNLDGQAIHVTDGSFPTGTKDVYELRTAGGYRLKLTADHKVWTRVRGWVQAKDLQPNDEVRLPSKPAVYQEVGEPQDAKFFQLLGLFLSTGNRHGAGATEVRLEQCLPDANLLEDFSRYVADHWADRAYADDYVNRSMVAGGGDASTLMTAVTNKRLISRLRAFVRTEVGQRRLGDEAFTAGLAAQKHLLRALFTADGVVTHNTIELRSDSPGLLEDVQLLLLGFGIQSSITSDFTFGQDGTSASGGLPGRQWTLGSTVPGQRGNEDGAPHNPPGPPPRGGADSRRHGLRIDPGSLRSFGKFVALLPGRSLEQLATACSHAIARGETEGNWDRIASFVPLGKQQVFDLTEPATHSFVANGLTVHNCSEYMFLDDTACNLASLNVLTFFDAEARRFDVESFKHGVRLWTVVLEISVLMASFPSEEIARLSYKFRTLGLGYANLGAMLMQAGIPYDSEKGRAVCAALTAILTGESYAASAEMARELGAFPGYEDNKADMLRVIRNHRRAAYDVSGNPAARRSLGDYERLDICPVGIDHLQFSDIDPMAPASLHHAAKDCWDRALKLGEKHGYRNAQTTVIAPTGTIGLLMDCDTTGVEPDFALVKFKKLAGGGYFKIANQSLEPALRNLGYQDGEIYDILRYVMGTLSLENTPHVNRDSLKSLGFTNADVDKIESALPGTFELSFAFSPWSLGAETMKRLGVDESESQRPGFNLLRHLGFTKKQIDEANDVVCGRGTVEGAPHLKDEHLPVFDCANRCGKHGQRFIPVEGHIRMMAAAQPFISGAISKTINLPNEATVEDIKNSYRLSWELGLKANALYRDGSKLSQPLNVKSDDDLEDKTDEEDADAVDAAKDEVAHDVALAAAATASDSALSTQHSALKSDNLTTAPLHTIEKIVERIVERPLRRRLPDTRRAITHKFDVGGHEGYITTGLYEDGTPGEVFIRISKEGSTIGGLMDTIATLVSLALQYGVPVESLVRKFEHVRFEPSGMTHNPDIPFAKSLVDYIFRYLAMEFVLGYKAANAPKRAEKKKPEAGSQTSASSVHGKPVEAKYAPPAALPPLPPGEGRGEGERNDVLLRPNGKKSGNGHGRHPEPDTAQPFDYGSEADEQEKLLKQQHSPHSIAPEAAPDPVAGVNLRLAIVADPLSQQGSELQADAPACDVCGSITVRSGTCYKCLNCGNSMGCS